MRHSEVEKRRALEKEFNKELMLVTWYPKRCWNFCLLEDEKKETEPIFLSNYLNVYSMKVLGYFATKT